MKALLLITAVLLLAFNSSYSQYCGNSGTTVCTPSGVLTPGSFTPNEDIPCIVRGQNSTIIVQFKNFGQAPGLGIPVDSVRFGSISALPMGLCWATNKSDNTFLNMEEGCIKVTGTTYMPAGQYKLSITLIVNAGVASNLQVDAESVGIRMYARVVDSGFTICPPIDSNQLGLYSPFTGNYSGFANIKGKVFYDLNKDSIYNAGDQGVPNQMLSMGSVLAITNSAGNYSAFVDSGNSYNVVPQLKGNTAQFSSFPTSQSVNAIGASTYPGNDFAIIIPPAFCDGDLSVVAQNPPPRPGFDNIVHVTYHNIVSGSPLTQHIRLYYSSIQSYVSAIPPPDVSDLQNHYLEWHTINLPSGSTWGANIIFNTPSTVSIGAMVTYGVVVVNSSCTTVNNASQSIDVSVVGSFDPNDKTPSPPGTGINGAVPLSTNEFKYTIRFQNTGTYSADNITVIDTISPYLDISTLKVMSASATYQVDIKQRTAKFVFNNINLPDSNSNEPGSHGYIQYSIKTNPALPNGTEIKNLADIYFDFNAPIRTNTASNTLDNTISGIAEAEREGNFVLYPNPNSGSIWQLNIDAGLIGQQLLITDMLGRLMYSTRIQSTISEINLDVLPGIYLAAVGGRTIKLLKE